MSDPVIWIIIIAFYAPLHYMLPVLLLFITGKESEQTRKELIRGVVIDASLSMTLAFGLAGLLIWMDQFMPAMVVLFLSMFAPYVRIVAHRREIAG